MHRNTYLLISILAVLAALVVGVNIGRTAAPPPISQSPIRDEVGPSPSAILTPSEPQLKMYRNSYCKISFMYPDNYTQLESASQAAAFRGPGASDGILLTCQKDIPRPSVTQENIEDIRVSSVSGKIYHTQSAKDGTVVDSLIIRHPVTKLDIFMAGSGQVFRDVVSTLTLTP